MNVSLTPELGERLNRSIEQAISQLDRGEGISADEARRLSKERIAARRHARSDSLVYR